MPIWRLSSSTATLFVDWVRKCVAKSHRVSGSLVEPKTVSLVTLHLCWQPAHW